MPDTITITITDQLARDFVEAPTHARHYSAEQELAHLIRRAREREPVGPRRDPEAENLLLDADELTSGERAEAYGPQLEAARAFAALATGATGLDIREHHLPVLMICLKLSRIRHTPRYRDHWLDIAGYARVAEMIFEQAKNENAHNLHQLLWQPDKEDTDGR